MSSEESNAPDAAEPVLTDGAPLAASGWPREWLTNGVSSAKVSRKAVLAGLVATAGAGLSIAGTSREAAAAPTQSVNVVDMGATGDGVTDDTKSVASALATAGDGEIYFPAGTYVIDGLVVQGTAHLRLDPGATLLAATNSPKGVMIQFNGSLLTITGGTIDGAKDQQTGRPVIVAGDVRHGASVTVQNVNFVRTVKAALYISNFGGALTVEGCTFSEQAEHNGVANDGATMIVDIISGEVGFKGTLRFIGNRAIGTDTPRVPGSNPGGVFVSPNSLANPDVGNQSTALISGNYFWGYGQNLAGNTVSAVHLYRSTVGVRVSDNYFEASSISAVTAKAVTDFVCVNNVFVGGVTSPQNVATQGVIAYVPGYNAGSVRQPRAVIAGNVIDGTGAQSSTQIQTAISVHGTAASRGADVVVANNVINGGGIGIHVLYVDDALVQSNIVKPAGVGVQAYYVDDIRVMGNTIRAGSGGAAGTQGGVVLAYVTGTATFESNVVETHNGHGLLALQSVNTARVTVRGNRFDHDATGYYAAVLRGMAWLGLVGNEVNAVGAPGVDVRGDGAGNKVGTLYADQGNVFVSGALTVVWADVRGVAGQIRAARSPLGVVTPREPGTIYQQLDGSGPAALWVSTGGTSTSWAQVSAGQSASSPSLNRLVGMTFDPAAASTAGALSASGTMHLSKVLLPDGGAASKVYFAVDAAGVGLKVGACSLGIYDTAGRLIGQSGDITTQLSSAGSKVVTLSTPLTGVAPGALVYVGIIWTGTTGPRLRGSDATLLNAGISSVSEARAAVAGTGLTTAPGTRPTGGSFHNWAPWIGLA